MDFKIIPLYDQTIQIINMRVKQFHSVHNVAYQYNESHLTEKVNCQMLFNYWVNVKRSQDRFGLEC